MRLINAKINAVEGLLAMEGGEGIAVFKAILCTTILDSMH
jgi:hypothetical protein